MSNEPLSAYVRRTGFDETSRDEIADRIAEKERTINGWADLVDRANRTILEFAWYIGTMSQALADVLQALDDLDLNEAVAKARQTIDAVGSRALGDLSKLVLEDLENALGEVQT